MAAPYYSCRRCRRFLFTPADVGSHVVGSHSFSYRRASKGCAAGGAEAPAAASPCTSFFLLDALPWMHAPGSAVSSKLSCPGCAARLGDLSWAGSQCSCGTWVTPAIQLQKKAVEARGAWVAAPLVGLAGGDGGGGGSGGDSSGGGGVEGVEGGESAARAELSAAAPP